MHHLDGSGGTSAKAHDGAGVGLVWAPDGQALAHWGAGTRVHLWWPDKGLSRTLQHGGTVSGAAFSLDGGRLFTASHDRTIRTWEVEDGGTRDLGKVAVGVDSWVFIRFSPDGRLVAAAGSGGIVRL